MIGTARRTSGPEMVFLQQIVNRYSALLLHFGGLPSQTFRQLDAGELKQRDGRAADTRLLCLGAVQPDGDGPAMCGQSFRLSERQGRAADFGQRIGIARKHARALEEIEH